MMRVPVVLVTLSVLFQAAWISAKHIKGPKKNVGVIGGEAINIEDAPWMAIVSTSYEADCAGTIVDTRLILTSVSCCESDRIRPLSEWKVRVGTDGRTPMGISVKVQDFIKYKKEGTDYNMKPTLCLLKLEKPLKYSLKIQSVSLEEPNTVIKNGTQVDFVAFGNSMLHEEYRELRRAKLPIVDLEWCKWESKRLDGGQICAGNTEHNACFGDVGGALTFGWNLIGVLSQATSDCRSNASRFCRISAYRDWIKKYMDKN